MKTYHYVRDGKYLNVQPHNNLVGFAPEEVQNIFQAGVEVPVLDMTENKDVPGGEIVYVTFPDMDKALRASGWQRHIPGRD